MRIKYFEGFNGYTSDMTTVEYLNYLGEEGWEYTGDSRMDTRGIHYLMSKCESDGPVRHSFGPPAEEKLKREGWLIEEGDIIRLKRFLDLNHWQINVLHSWLDNLKRFSSDSQVGLPGQEV